VIFDSQVRSYVLHWSASEHRVDTSYTDGDGDFPVQMQIKPYSDCIAITSMWKLGEERTRYSTGCRWPGRHVNYQ
jgi:hypothetical protein